MRRIDKLENELLFLMHRVENAESGLDTLRVRAENVESELDTLRLMIRRLEHPAKFKVGDTVFHHRGEWVEFRVNLVRREDIGDWWIYDLKFSGLTHGYVYGVSESDLLSEDDVRELSKKGSHAKKV